MQVKVTKTIKATAAIFAIGVIPPVALKCTGETSPTARTLGIIN